MCGTHEPDYHEAWAREFERMARAQDGRHTPEWMADMGVMTPDDLRQLAAEHRRLAMPQLEMAL
jgi:hypothetical protein